MGALGTTTSGSDMSLTTAAVLLICLGAAVCTLYSIRLCVSPATPVIGRIDRPSAWLGVFMGPALILLGAMTVVQRSMSVDAAIGAILFAILGCAAWVISTLKRSSSRAQR